MSKPLGVSLKVGPSGPRMAVTGNDRVVDGIWEAVREAVFEGWTPEQFKHEIMEAWEHEKKALLKAELDALK